MMLIIGLIVVFGSVAGGYLMHHGELRLLWQPNEVVIIFGAAVGSVIVGNQKHILKYLIKSFGQFMKGVPYSKDDYLELLLFFFNATKLMKTKGLMALESHVEQPEESELFKNSKVIMQNPDISEFLRSSLRVMIMGIDQASQLEDVVNYELELLHHTYTAPAKAMAGLADALPALGIVAAVLGVIITMKSIAEPPTVLGGLIGAALVGTFLGVLLSYGVFGPMGGFLDKYAEYRMKYFDCIKIGLISYLQGVPPVLVVEFMRKSIPTTFRPSFHEVEAAIAANTFKG